MTDDLVKRARDTAQAKILGPLACALLTELADRIEEREAEVARLRTHDLHSECEQNCSWYQAQKEALADVLTELALYRKKRPER